MSKRTKVKLDAVSKAVEPQGNETAQPPKATETAPKNGKGKTLSTVESEQLEVPDETWDVDRLGEFAQGQENFIRLWEKRQSVHVHRQGHALSVAKAKVDAGEWKGSKHWSDFLKRYKIPVTSDWRVRTLYERCPDEKTVKKLGITEAYREFGLLAWKDDEPAAATPKPGGKEQKKVEPPPPPKEDPKTIAMFLSQVLQRLEFFFDEPAFIDQDKEAPDHVRSLIDETISKLRQMREMLPVEKPAKKTVKKKAKGNG